MTITIQLDEQLLLRLRNAASARNLSPEELGSELLGGAIERIEPAADWPERNRRRGELIDKKFRAGGLTAAEVQELEDLQAALEQQLTPVDQKRLDWLRQMEERVQKLPVQ